jgi:sulfide:quinone oxidoreductase
VRWIKAAVAAFEPDKNIVILDGCRVVKYTASLSSHRD